MIDQTQNNATLVTSDRYMNERVDFKINLYQWLSRRNKILYYLVGSGSIMLAATVPVAVNFFEQNLVPTILSLALTILVGLEKLFLFREHWKNYDYAEELLRREKYLFQARAGVYSGRKNDNSEFEPLSDDVAFHLFVTNFESIIHDERSDTIEKRTRALEQFGA